MRRSLLRTTCLLLALAPGLGLPLLASAGTLEATVTGKSGKPKPYVRVELIGPQSQTLFTNKEGLISTELSGGDYVVRVTERNRRMEFEVEVPERGQVTPVLELEW